MYSHWSDHLFAWLAVVGVLAIVTFVRPSAGHASGTRSERHCESLLLSALTIGSGIALNCLFGWIFLVGMQIASPLWTFWGLAYWIGGLITLYVLPILVLVGVTWAILGRWRVGFSTRSLWLASGSLLVLALDCLFLYAEIAVWNNAA